jgi:PAS domain S-box-containing protein
MALTSASCPTRQEEPFKLLFDRNPVPMWLHDSDSLKILAANEAAAALYGYSEQALITMSLLDLVPKDQRDVIEKVIRDNPLLKEGTRQVWQHIKADGSKIEVLTSWRDLLFRDIPAQLVAVMDMTEKRFSEKHGGASAGIVLASADGETSDELLKNVDLALQWLEHDLRNALRCGQFELAYQPVVNIKTGDISGLEALLRWRSPEHGLVSAEKFIPVAEAAGLIVPIGEWVLGEACTVAATWPGHLKLAVNLSPVQFKKCNLSELVRTVLADSGLPAELLELEITESILLEESEANLATLRHLRALGVSISLDDFGTGYSSLNYLRWFTFDKIKIDRSFVAEIGKRAECLAIVRAISTLAAEIGIPTVAEGVETEAQRELLRKVGCSELQGYWISRPVSADEIAKLLDARGRRAENYERL